MLTRRWFRALLLVAGFLLPLDVLAADVDGLFDVGGRAIHLASQGRGSPVVVVDAGLGTAPAEDASWQHIASAVAPVTTVCLYDRAGLGTSGRRRESDN